jgi:hypothetical protein
MHALFLSSSCSPVKEVGPMFTPFSDEKAGAPAKPARNRRGGFKFKSFCPKSRALFTTLGGRE